MQNIGKGLHKLFKSVVNDISQVLPILVESGSEVSYFIPYPRNFSEVSRFFYDKNKTWLKVSMREINNLINNHTFIVQVSERGEPVHPCVDV